MSPYENEHASLLPSESLALAIYRCIESVGVGQWRTATFADMANYVNCHDARLTDNLKDLWSHGYLALQKWQPPSKRFVSFAADDSDEDFFYRGSFQIKVEPRGRPYFEGLVAREKIEKPQSISAVNDNPSDFRNERNMQPRRLKIFLCHASDDKIAVRKLCQQLRLDGFFPWLDDEELLPGQEWEQEIQKAVRTSDVVLVCLSRSSITKEGFVQKEIRLALDVADEKPQGTIFIIPARLEPCQVPDRLRRWQWVDLSQEGGYDDLLRSLSARAAGLGISEPTDEGSTTTESPSASPPAHNPAPESLAGKFQDAVARRELEQRAARELAETKTRFENIARQAAPAEFEKLADLLRTRADIINAKRPSGMPVMQYVPINHRLDAGKYAIELDPLAGLRSYSLTVLVGLHPNAQQFMDKVPRIKTIKQTFTATTDEQGFAWRDAHGNVRSPDQIVSDALNALVNLLIEGL